MKNQGETPNQTQNTKLQSKAEVEFMVSYTRQHFNYNPNINDEINFIVVVVQSNYPEEFECIKNILADQIVYQFCQYINQCDEVDSEIKKFNGFLEAAGKHNISIIRNKYKQEIEIAIKIYDDNWKLILQSYCAHLFLDFQFYNKKLKDYEKGNRIKYLKLIKFEPLQEKDQFQNSCLQVFNELYHNQENGIQNLNLELINKNAEFVQQYANTKIQSMIQRLNQQYPDDFRSINWEQKIQIILAQLKEKWRGEMKNQEIDVLLDLKKYEYEIKSEIYSIAIAKAFIDLGILHNQYYLFDEEYEMIEKNAKISEISKVEQYQQMLPRSLAEKFYGNILQTLEPIEQIEKIKHQLLEQIANIQIESKQMNGKAIQLCFNQIRKQIIGVYRNCSFSNLIEQETEEVNLSQILLQCLNQEFEQIMGTITQESGYLQIQCDLDLAKIRKLLKIYINNEEEYQQMINEQDPQFQQIMQTTGRIGFETTNQIGLEDDLIDYLENQIDEFQQVKFLEWLNKSWNLCKEELMKYQDIDENELTKKFEEFQNTIEKTIRNEITQLDQERPLVDQFRKKWNESKWEEKVIDIFVTLYKE